MRAGTRSPRAVQGGGAQGADLPDVGGGADEPGEHGGGGVAADGRGAPALGVIGERSTPESRSAGQTVGYALDEAECGRGGAERRGEQAREQRGRDLVTHVREEAGHADAPNPGRQPLCGPVLAAGIAWAVARVSHRREVWPHRPGPCGAMPA